MKRPKSMADLRLMQNMPTPSYTAGGLSTLSSNR